MSGNGEQISLWHDNWLPSSAANIMNIPDHVLPRLKAKVKDLIQGTSWHFPDTFSEAYPELVDLIREVHIPVVSTEDTLVWKHSSSGLLSLK